MFQHCRSVYSGPIGKQFTNGIKYKFHLTKRFIPVSFGWLKNDKEVFCIFVQQQYFRYKEMK